MFTAPVQMTMVHAAAARDAGVAAIRSGTTQIDLTPVAAVDSSAVAVLLAWRRAAAAAGQPLHLHALPPALVSLASVYGVDELIDSPS